MNCVKQLRASIAFSVSPPKIYIDIVIDAIVIVVVYTLRNCDKLHG